MFWPRNPMWPSNNLMQLTGVSPTFICNVFYTFPSLTCCMITLPSWPSKPKQRKKPKLYYTFCTCRHTDTDTGIK